MRNSRRKSAARFSPAQASRRRAFYGAMNPQRASQYVARPVREAHAHHIPPDTDHCAAHVTLAGEW